MANQHDLGRAWPPEAGLFVGGHEALVTKRSEKRQLKIGGERGLGESDGSVSDSFAESRGRTRRVILSSKQKRATEASPIFRIVGAR